MQDMIGCRNDVSIFVDGTLERHQRAAKVHEQRTKCWTGQKFIDSLQ